MNACLFETCLARGCRSRVAVCWCSVRWQKKVQLRFSALKVRIEEFPLRMLAPTQRQLEQDGFYPHGTANESARVGVRVWGVNDGLAKALSQQFRTVRWDKAKSPGA